MAINNNPEEWESPGEIPLFEFKPDPAPGNVRELEEIERFIVELLKLDDCANGLTKSEIEERLDCFEPIPKRNFQFLEDAGEIMATGAKRAGTYETGLIYYATPDPPEEDADA